MKTSYAIKKFVNKNRLALALGISRQAIEYWGENVPRSGRWGDRVAQIRALMKAHNAAT